jgi:hypothetical protein
VRFLIADYFAVSDLSVLRGVSEFDEETCVGARDLLNALEKASTFVTESSFPKWLLSGILHECHIFHFFSGDRVDDGVCLVMPRPMVVSEGDGHVGGVHSVEVVLGQVVGRESLAHAVNVSFPLVSAN